MPSPPPRLKPLSKGGVVAALERAERYRLLNEPSQAESICLDILEVEPENEKAIVLLLLAITDGFVENTESAARALALLPRLKGDYPAEGLRTPGNDDSILRYNACVRLLTSTSSIQEAPKPDPSDLME
jgi:hypothetical protein